MSRIDRAASGCVAIVSALGALTAGYKTAQAAWMYRNCSQAVSNQYRLISLLLPKSCSQEFTQVVLAAGATFLLTSVTLAAIIKYKKVVRVQEPPVSPVHRPTSSNLFDFVPKDWANGGMP